MKKLFVSVPTYGRDRVTVMEEMHKILNIVNVLFDDEEYELINSYFTVDNPNDITEYDKINLLYLSKKIERMAYADLFAYEVLDEKHRDCSVEIEIARLYRIPVISIDLQVDCFNNHQFRCTSEDKNKEV